MGFALLVMSVFGLPSAARAASTLYVGPGGGAGPCAAPYFSSIQTAINGAAAGDTVHICAGAYRTAGLTVNIALTLEGDGAATTTIANDGAYWPIIYGNRASAITIKGLTVRDGKSGGIMVPGSVTVIDSVFLANRSDGAGAAIRADSVSVSRSSFIGNSSSGNGAGNGGAIYFTSVIAVEDSYFSGNSAIGAAYGSGGAIGAEGPASATISRSTFVSNRGANGGAVYAGPTTITNSTFSGNTAINGGGSVYSWGPVVVESSTLSGGSGLGGAIKAPSATITNTIISQGAPNACSAAMSDGGGNFATDTSCGLSAPTSQVVTVGALALEPPADNGGLTPTMALGTGSVARDAGVDATCILPPVGGVDQRSVARPQGPQCDSGAYEVVLDPALPSTTTSLAADPNPVVQGLPTTLTATVTPDPGGGTVTWVIDGAIAGSTPVTGGGIATVDRVLGAPGPHAVQAWFIEGATFDNSHSGSLVVTVNADPTPPTAVLEAPVTPTSATTLPYEVTFSESVTGFATDDLAVSGTATGCVMGTPSGSGAEWTVSIAGCSSGTVTLQLKAGAVTDPAGNPGPTADVSASSVTIDRSAPSATLTSPATPTTATTLSYDLAFSESVSELDAADFTHTGTAIDCVVGAPTGSGASYTVPVASCSVGTVTLTLEANSVVDAAGNTGPAADVTAALVAVALTPFTDIAGSPFKPDIEWVYTEGITSGCTATTYCPEGYVTREQMASFLARALKLSGTAPDAFTDDESSIHEPNINLVAKAGIATGCAAGKYCPTALVSREQMASLPRPSPQARRLRPRRLHRRRAEHPRAQHQPRRPGGRGHRLRQQQVLPHRQRHPWPDGRLPPPGLRAVGEGEGSGREEVTCPRSPAGPAVTRGAVRSRGHGDPGGRRSPCPGRPRLRRDRANGIRDAGRSWWRRRH